MNNPISPILNQLLLYSMYIYLNYRAIEVCSPDKLRRLATTRHDLLTHEKSLDCLIDLLQKDQLHDSLSLNALDKAISLYKVLIDLLAVFLYSKIVLFFFFSTSIKATYVKKNFLCLSTCEI